MMQIERDNRPRQPPAVVVPVCSVCSFVRVIIDDVTWIYCRSYLLQIFIVLETFSIVIFMFIHLNLCMNIFI